MFIESEITEFGKNPDWRKHHILTELRERDEEQQELKERDQIDSVRIEIENQIQDISKAKGVVFDLRGYPNNNHDVISYLIENPVRSAKWNIPEKLLNMIMLSFSGIWNIPGIYQNKCPELL